MKTYERKVKITGFHTIRTKGAAAEVQYSFQINIEGGWRRESLTEWFDNIGDAPHIGETITVEVQVFIDGNEYEQVTLERIGW